MDIYKHEFNTTAQHYKVLGHSNWLSPEHRLSPGSFGNFHYKTEDIVKIMQCVLK